MLPVFALAFLLRPFPPPAPPLVRVPNRAPRVTESPSSRSALVSRTAPLFVAPRPSSEAPPPPPPVSPRRGASAWPLEASLTEAESSRVASRVVAVGDVHGDLEALVQCLRLGGLVREGPGKEGPGEAHSKRNETKNSQTAATLTISRTVVAAGTQTTTTTTVDTATAGAAASSPALSPASSPASSGNERPNAVPAEQQQQQQQEQQQERVGGEAFESLSRNPLADALTWAGGMTKLVLVGDLLDRGDDELEILEFLARLRGEARRAGGAVVCLFGNHELMNALGDFRYTSPAGNRGFGHLSQRVLESNGGAWGKWGGISESKYPGLRARAAGMAPGGILAKEHLARFPVAAIVHGTAFVHGALTPDALASMARNAANAAGEDTPAGEIVPRLEGKKVQRGDASQMKEGGWEPRPVSARAALRHLNRATRKWLRGGDPEPPRDLMGPTSALWSRAFGSPAAFELGQDEAEGLATALELLGAERMVIGHTPQSPGGPGINAAECAGGGSGKGKKVWRVDTGMCAVLGGKREVLEITTFYKAKAADAQAEDAEAEAGGEGEEGGPKNDGAQRAPPLQGSARASGRPIHAAQAEAQARVRVLTAQGPLEENQRPAWTRPEPTAGREVLSLDVYS